MMRLSVPTPKRVQVLNHNTQLSIPLHGILALHLLSKDQIELEVMLRWLKHFKLRFHQAHASGHCSLADLKWLIGKIKPKVVMPVHTEHPELFKKFVKTKITQPKYEKMMKIR